MKELSISEKVHIRFLLEEDIKHRKETIQSFGRTYHSTADSSKAVWVKAIKSCAFNLKDAVSALEKVSL